VAILDGILVLLTGLGVTYIIFKNARHYRYKKVESWGRLYYADKWEEQRAETHAQADIFFMLEFVVGFPGMRLKCVTGATT